MRIRKTSLLMYVKGSSMSIGALSHKGKIYPVYIYRY